MKPLKGKVSQVTTHNKEYKIVTNQSFLPYFDEGTFYYKSKGRFQFKKRLLKRYQVRAYRTWKHNKAKQWQK